MLVLTVRLINTSTPPARICLQAAVGLSSEKDKTETQLLRSIKNTGDISWFGTHYTRSNWRDVDLMVRGRNRTVWLYRSEGGDGREATGGLRLRPLVSHWPAGVFSPPQHGSVPTPASPAQPASLYSSNDRSHNTFTTHQPTYLSTQTSRPAPNTFVNSQLIITL